MEYRLLGRTGVRVSAICLGTWMFGLATEPTEAYRIVDTGLGAGINFIDTANVYSRGVSEEITGEALKRNGTRNRVILATKVHGGMADDDPNMQGTSRRHVIQQCEASLRRLKTDYIDLYQLHRPRTDLPIDETLRALDDLIRDGKVRYIGTSTYAAWQLLESLWVSREYGLNRFISEQPPYHILDRRIEREMVPMALSYGIGILPWSPLAGGLLTGKYRRGQAPPDGSRFGRNSNWDHRLVEDGYRVIEGLQPLAQAKGCSMAQFALGWVMHQRGITSSIIGPRTHEQLEDNLGAATIEISDADCEAVDKLVPPGSMISPFYEADFGPSQFRW